jgi:predicted MPP superfamily phosphohydrolase
MRNLSFILFIGTFLFIYALAHFYVWLRLRQLWPHNERYFWYFTIAYALLAISFVAGRFMIHSHSLLHEIIAWTGSYWLIIALYLFIAILLFDLIRLTNWLVPFLPPRGTTAYMQLRYWMFYGMFGVVMVVVLWGHWNAVHPRIKQITISTHKDFGLKRPLSIVAVSDLHMGSLVGKQRLERMVDQINQLNPDIVILAGDLLDEAHGFIFKRDIGEPIRKLKATYGVYAVPGNHEYIGGIASSEKYIRTLSLQWLKDSAVRTGNHITIIGRDDRQGYRMHGKSRKTLPDLLANVDPADFNILIDHQPFHLEETAKYPIDLQISGHTHDGQFWPFNHVVQWVYTLPYGYAKIGNTHFYVSSGYGTWGPPVRIATIPEIVHIVVTRP